MTSREALEKLLKSEPYLSIPSWDFQLRTVKGDLSYLSDHHLQGIKENIDDYLATGKEHTAIKDLDPMI